jgi:hypothetical protein
MTVTAEALQHQAAVSQFAMQDSGRQAQAEAAIGGL